MAMKRRASASFECSLSKRVWGWRSRVFGAFASPFYHCAASFAYQTPSNADAKDGPVNIDTQDRNPHAIIDDTDTLHHPQAQESLSVQTMNVSEAESNPFDMICNPESTSPIDEQDKDEEETKRPLIEPSPDGPDNNPTSDERAPKHVIPLSPGQSTWTSTRLRSRTPQDIVTSHSRAILGMFQEAYEFQCPQEQFIGLCAYLSCVMQLGYRIRTAEMDGFIRMHAVYTQELKHLEAQQVRGANPRLIAYHHWYSQRGRGQQACDGKAIITEQRLRQIWSENPFAFLKVQRSLNYIIERRPR